MNIFVGNLSFEAKDADVYKLFMGFGKVTYVSIVMDKKGKRSRGFGFLEMPDEQEAQAAIAALNAKEFMGRPLNIEPARAKPEAGRDSRNFEKTGEYRKGRRTRSFLRKRAKAGIEEQVMPQRKNKENPMRWRKKREQPKPWQKKGEESKPWQKSSNHKKQSQFKGREKSAEHRR